MGRGALAAALTALMLMCAPAAQGQDAGGTYYLDPAGLGGVCSDARLPVEAASLVTPWCSFARAAEAAPPNSVVVVRQATFPSLVFGGQRGSFVTFRPAGGEQVVVENLAFSDAGFVRLEGFRVTSRVLVERSSHHIQLVGNALQGVNLIAGVDNVLIEGNQISNPSGTAINLSSDSSRPPITDVAIRGNRFDNIAIDAIQAKGFRNLLIEGNEFTGVRRTNPGAHPDVLQTVAGGSNLVFRSNWLHDYESQGVFIAGAEVTNVVVENNLIEESDGPFVELSMGRTTNGTFVNNTIIGLTRAGPNARNVVLKNNILRKLALDPDGDVDEDYNLVSTGDSRGANDIRGAPKFADADAGNYELAADSPAVDAGTSSAAPTLDLLGRLRVDDSGSPNRGAGLVDYVDMGALERGGRFPVPLDVPIEVFGLTVRLKVPHQRLGRIVNEGLLVNTICDAACGISASLLIDRGAARRLGLARGPAKRRFVRIGRGARRLRAAGTADVTVRLKRKARTRLARVRWVPVLLRLTVKDGAGHSVRVARRLTLLQAGQFRLVG